MARPRIEWTDEQRRIFEELCRIQCTREEVCRVLGVTAPTLARLIEENYPEAPTWAEAFDIYSAEGRASLRRKQYEMAMAGDRTMLVWLGKQYLGQTDAPKTEAKTEQGKLEQFRSLKGRRRA